MTCLYILLIFILYSYIFRGAVFYSNEVSKWCIPFLGSDVSVVRRSQRHRVQAMNKNQIQYGAYMGLSSLFAVFLLMFFGLLFAMLCRFKRGRSLLEKVNLVFTGDAHTTSSLQYSIYKLFFLIFSILDFSLLGCFHMKDLLKNRYVSYQWFNI
jgi:hypothetical protein